MGKEQMPNPYEDILDDERLIQIIKQQEEDWIKDQETWAKDQ